MGKMVTHHCSKIVNVLSLERIHTVLIFSSGMVNLNAWIM